MGEAYYNANDAYMRLNGTLCLYDGKPKYITVDQLENGEVRAYEMTPELKDYKKVDYRDKAFNYKPFPLGYLNYEGKAMYMTRKPSRNQTQGLVKHCVLFSHHEPYNRYGWFTSEAMENAILGKYPTYREALESVEVDGEGGMAFDRHFAIENLGPNQTGLCYRGRLCATKGKKEKAFTLFKGEDTSFMLKILPKIGVEFI